MYVNNIKQLTTRFLLLCLLIAQGAAPAFAQKKVILQAFWWDYQHNSYPNGWANYLADLAPTLRALGIDGVWVPPNAKGGSGTWDNGYGPFDHYDLGDKYQKGTTGTRSGTKDELLRMYAVLHANGLEVIQDIVPNHVYGAGSDDGSGGQDNCSPTCSNNCSDAWKNFRYACYETPAIAQTATNYLARKGRFPKNWMNFHPNTAHNCNACDANSDAWCWQGFGPDVCYYDGALGQSNTATYNPTQSSYSPYNNGGTSANNGYMRKHYREWLVWYKKQTGFDGVRIDAVKHFEPAATEDFLWNMQSGAGWANGGTNMYAVGEFVGSSSDLDNWCTAVQNRSGTFDFSLRGALYGMVYGFGNYNLADIDNAQQFNKQRTVPFVNNHDTFRPNLDGSGNYAGWNTGSELAPHIEPNEPRLSAAYAAMMAFDGNPMLFIEDLFDLGYAGTRFTHNPGTIVARSDLRNIIWCHQNLGFKDGSAVVRHESADHLIIERTGRAIIGINDNWDTWQNIWVYTGFAPGTQLKDYSGANGTDIKTVNGDGWANINTPPCNGSANQGRRGYSIWAPVGQDSDNYVPSRGNTTTQEWEMNDDLGDSHCSSLGQGGKLPQNSCAYRIVGKIYAQSGTTVSYEFFDDPAVTGIDNIVEFYNASSVRVHCNNGSADFTGSFTAPATGWYTAKVRHNPGVACAEISPNACNNELNPSTDVAAQKVYLKITYRPPASASAGTNLPTQLSDKAFWTGAANDNDFSNPRNWEDCNVPTATSSAIVVPPCTPGLVNIPTGTLAWRDVAGNPVTAPLDVNFISFTGKNVNNQAQLTWRVIADATLLDFTVEKSTNGRDFEKIGTVAALGSAGEATYSFIDRQFTTDSYYRLVNNEIDAHTTSYSPTVFVTYLPKGSGQFTLQPNPTKNTVQLVAESLAPDSQLQVILSTMAGQAVAQGQGTLADVQALLQTWVAAQPAGLYVVKVLVNNQTTTLKLMKE